MLGTGIAYMLAGRKAGIDPRSENINQLAKTSKMRE